MLLQDELQEGLHRGEGVLSPFVFSIGHPVFQDSARGHRKAVNFSPGVPGMKTSVLLTCSCHLACWTRSDTVLTIVVKKCCHLNVCSNLSSM